MLCDNVLRVTGRSRESLTSWARCRRVTRNKRSRELDALLESGAVAGKGGAVAGFTESGRKVALPPPAGSIMVLSLPFSCPRRRPGLVGEAV